MGNHVARMSTSSENPVTKGLPGPQKKWESVSTFKFHDKFIEDTNNGLYFNNLYLPEEVVILILSYIDPKELLNATLVCKKWCNLIKSDTFWATIYSRHYNKKAKKLPWYVYYCLFTTKYFDQNLLKNGNGEKKYEHWTIVLNYGDGFKIEKPPVGADPLPLDVPEFNGNKSCFATSYGECNKLQEISLENSRLMQLILNQFKPHIYLSEWVAARFDCGCNYTLWCRLLGKQLSETSGIVKPDYRFRNHFDPDFLDVNDFEESFDEHLHVVKTGKTIAQWVGSAWSKIEMIVKDYPSGVRSIIFQHQGVDTQFWKGHYGCKMAGGVLKILFDSIQPNV